MMFFLNSQPDHAQFLILNHKGLFESPISPLVYYSEIFLDLQDTGHILTFKLFKNGASGSK